jgi:hypothetical protein
MVAGTSTPLTSPGLQGGGPPGPPVAIWAVAAIGIALKLWQPRRIEAISVALYLGLGWIGLIALHPFTAAFDTATLALLATGGILYSVGVVFPLWRRLPFHNAILHGFVLIAAGLHYFAVLTVVSDVRLETFAKRAVTRATIGHASPHRLPTICSSTDAGGGWRWCWAQRAGAHRRGAATWLSCAPLASAPLAIGPAVLGACDGGAEASRILSGHRLRYRGCLRHFPALSRLP